MASTSSSRERAIVEPQLVERAVEADARAFPRRSPAARRLAIEPARLSRRTITGCRLAVDVDLNPAAFPMPS